MCESFIQVTGLLFTSGGRTEEQVLMTTADPLTQTVNAPQPKGPFTETYKRPALCAVYSDADNEVLTVDSSFQYESCK